MKYLKTLMKRRQIMKHETSINSDRLINKNMEEIAYGAFKSSLKDIDPQYVCTWSSDIDRDIDDDDLIGMLMNIMIKDKSQIQIAIQLINSVSKSMNLPKSPSIALDVGDDGVLITFVQYLNRISGEILDYEFGETYEQKVYDVTE
jgi:hypothetical protein